MLPALFLLVQACSEAPKQAEKTQPPAKPPEPVTGRYAFHQMYIAARSWAPDVMVLNLASIPLPEVQSVPGKAGAWQATFVSESRGRARMYTYSVVESAGNLHKGVFSGSEEQFSGQRGQQRPFLAEALKTDSDEVYKEALKHAAEYDKKHPGMIITFVLESTPRFPDPAWRVIWGESVSTSNFSVYIDATTGKYLQTMR